MKHHCVGDSVFGGVRGWLAAACAAGLLQGCTNSYDALESDEVCKQIGYAISNKTLECTSDPELADTRYLDFRDRYTCRLEEVQGEKNETYDRAFSCAQRILKIPCPDILVDPGSYEWWLQGDCAEALSGPSLKMSCDQLLARIDRVLHDCQKIDAATADMYAEATRALYRCSPEADAGAIAACAGAVTCSLQLDRWSAVEVFLKSGCSSVFEPLPMGTCDALKLRLPLALENTCNMPAATYAAQLSEAASLLHCREDATAMDACLAPACPSEGELPSASDWKRRIATPTCCTQLLDTCTCWSTYAESVVFYCTGDEQLSSAAAAELEKRGLCSPCAKIDSCLAETTVDGWVAGIQAIIESTSCPAGGAP